MFIKQNEQGVVLQLKIKPRSKAEGPVAAKSTANLLFWAVKAPPVDGKANEALIRSLSKFFRLTQSEVQILRGETSTTKVVLLAGAALDEVKKALECMAILHLPPGGA